MKHFKKDEIKRIIIKNFIANNKSLLFDIVDYLNEFDIPEIKEKYMYSKDCMIIEMEEIVKNKGIFGLINSIDYQNFNSNHEFYNYNSHGKIYSISSTRYYINLLECIDAIVAEILKDPELLKM